MAFRSPSYCLRSWMQLRSGLGGNAAYTTSTTPKMKVYASPTMAELGQAAKSGSNKVERTVKKHGDFVPVYVALGLILLSVSFGVHITKQHLMYSPAVKVRKSKRGTLSELEEPEHTLDEAEKFIKKSFFRKVAHIQESNRDPATSDPTRGDVLTRPLRAETLKEVGVDTKLPKVHAKQ